MAATVITETVTGPVETSSSTRFDDRGRAVAQQESASGLPDVCTMSTYADDADDVAWRVATQTKADQACPGSGTTLDTAMITAAARHLTTMVKRWECWTGPATKPGPRTR